VDSTAPTSVATHSKPAVPSLLHSIVILSGFAGLGYQMLWSRMLAAALGHEIVAVLAVVAAFFVGLSLGAFVLGQRLQRSSQPARWYAAMELAIALWALLVLLVLPHYTQLIPQLIGAEPGPWRHWGIAFASSLLLLLPATAAMGATLPALERIASALVNNTQDTQQHTVAGLYASNTLGAVAGTLLTTFFLIPAFGHGDTLLLLVGINLLCALASLALLRYARPLPAAIPVYDHNTNEPFPRLRLLSILFITGWLGIGYEILMVRLLSQVLENTVYTFASVLAVYLLGVTLGAAAYHQREGRQPVAAQPWTVRLRQLLMVTTLAMASGGAALYFSPTLYQVALELTGAVAAELLVAGSVFLLPTLAMGALFSHLVRHAVGNGELGKALAVNTLGAALAPVCIGLVLLPFAGAKLTLALLLAGYLPCLLLCLPRHRQQTLRWAWPIAGVSLVLVLLFWLTPPLRFISMAPDSKLIAYQDGVMASVAVIEDGAGDRHLKVNNHFTMGGTATRFSDHRQSHLPLLLHGTPHSALYLGLGTGISFEAAQYYPGLATTGVDLIPETLSMMPWFGVDPAAQDWQPMPHLLAADARRFVLSTQDNYDVIIGEIFHPSRDGAGSLYTLEQFQAIRQRLNEDGLFAQWLPLFQLDLNTLKTIIRTFLQAYPDAQLYLGHLSLQQPILCLVGRARTDSATPNHYPPNWLADRIIDPRLQQELVRERLNSDLALFGSYLAGPQDLQAYAGPGPINSDDHPVVTYQAPNFVYGNPAPPASRLLQLIDQLHPGVESLLQIDPASDDANYQAIAREYARQLQQYWQARNLFLQTGTGLSASTDIRRIVQHSRQPLLQALTISPQFEPAYRALVGSAQALYEVDRYQSYELLSDILQVAPQYRQAAVLRRHLFGH